MPFNAIIPSLIDENWTQILVYTTMEAKKRRINCNSDEKGALMKLVEENKNIIENKESDAVNNKKKEDCWEKITKYSMI